MVLQALSPEIFNFKYLNYGLVQFLLPHLEADSCLMGLRINRHLWQRQKRNVSVKDLKLKIIFQFIFILNSDQFKPKSYLKLIKKYIFSDGKQFPLTPLLVGGGNWPPRGFSDLYQVKSCLCQRHETWGLFITIYWVCCAKILTSTLCRGGSRDIFVEVLSLTLEFSNIFHRPVRC